MRKRFLNLTLALGLVAGLFVGAIGSASAVVVQGQSSQAEWVYYPWVPNGEYLQANWGPWHGVITVQNLEDYTIWVDVYRGGTGSPVLTTTLRAHASKTFSAAMLGIGDPGQGVGVRGTWYVEYDLNTTNGAITDRDLGNRYPGCTTRGTLNNNGTPLDPTDDFFQGTLACDRGPQIGGVQKQYAPTNSAVGRTSAQTLAVTGSNAIPDEDVPWGASSVFCHNIWQDCNSVGGYDGTGQPLIYTFDGHQYLPIVQTNTNWNSVIHVTNIDRSSPQAAGLTITLYSAFGQGAFGPSVGVFTVLLNPGQSARVDLMADMGVPAGWVGSAWLTSDYGMVASVDRVKPSTNMAITNTAGPSYWATTTPSGAPGDLGPYPWLASIGTGYELYAPLIFRHYNGWNTGINIANVAEYTNTVTVTYYNNGVAVGSDSVSIPAKAMEYIFIPYSQDLGLPDREFVGSAVLRGTGPFHAAIDQVKYSSGEAMSYIATGASASVFDYVLNLIGDIGQIDLLNQIPNASLARLSLPLVQKGTMVNGVWTSDITGINLFNANATSGATVNIRFYMETGAWAAPTLNAPLQITLSALGNATVYTPFLSEMSQNFQGSAVVTPVFAGRLVPLNWGRVVGVSNNVNYDVIGDGSASYNLYNTWGQFRLFSSQTPWNQFVGVSPDPLIGDIPNDIP